MNAASNAAVASLPARAARAFMALVLAIGTSVYLPSNASAVGEDAGSWTLWVQGYSISGGDDSINGGIGYKSEDGDIAYCYDYDSHGPWPEGATYTHMKRGNTVTDYLVAKSYPNTNKIAGKTWSDGKAQSISQAAAWIASGTVSASSLGGGEAMEAAKQLVKEAEAYKGGDPSIDGCSSIIFVDGKREVQAMLLGNLFGHISLQKLSSIKATTDGNGAYDLSKARYGIFTDKACTDSYRGYHLTTDAEHNANLDLVPGTYYVKETTTPPGFATDGTVYKVKVKSGQTTKVDGSGKVYDTPQSDALGLILEKVDADTGESAPQGDGSLEGAQFRVDYFDNTAGDTSGDATRSWTFKTDGKGRIELGDKASGYYVSGDNLYKNSSGKYCFPLGTYKFTEVKAPEGYNLSDETPVMTVKGSGDKEQTGSYAKVGNTKVKDGVPAAGDDVIRGGVAISKQDAQTGNAEQGDATFEGAVFEITNLSDGPVKVDGELYGKDEAVKRITTAWDEEAGMAIASTSADCLPYGTYRIDEVEAPVGYLNTGTISRTFEIREDGKVVDLTSSEPIVNDVVRGGVMVEKDDLELGKSEAIGGKDHSSATGANLNGIEFTIANASEHAVVVGDGSFEPGDVIMAMSTAWSDEEQAYVASTAEDALPYGTYTVTETATNDSYLLTDGEPKTFQVRKEGVVVKATPDGDDLTFSDQVVRQDLKLTKKAGNRSNESLQVAFLLTNATTGEAHVLVADRNGQASTAASWNAHTRNTNANDALASYDGPIPASAMDARAGIWFGLGEDGSMAAADDALAALPFGEYRLQELRCESNEGYRLIDKPFWVERDSTAAEPIWMSLTDEEGPGIGTEARDADGDQTAQAAKEVTIVDTCNYRNLDIGETYTVTGTLMVKETGEPLVDAEGNPVTGQTTFECAAEDGTVEVVFTFDGSLLAGKTVVAFEDMTSEGLEVCSHMDIEDEGQSVHFVDIGTTAADASDGDKLVTGEEVVLNDEVSYTGLTPGEEYALEATLVDAATGKPVTDADGSPVTGNATFTPEEADGSTTVELRFSAEGLGGHDLVCFERLYAAGGVLTATHEDIGDEGQTVHAVEIGTTLSDGEDAEHYAEPGPLKLADAVEYKGLTPGSTYTMSGKLVDKATGEAIKDGEGNELSSAVEFTPEEADGTVEVVFEFDSADMAGRSLVAFEQCLDAEGKIVASHEDEEDEGQTVHVVEIGTTLTDAADGDHHAAPGPVKLTDTVAYKGLVPGMQYTMAGKLVDKESGETVKDPQGNEAAATADFTPEEPEGTVDITFELDASGLDGKALVAFERCLSAEGEVIAKHEDKSDEGQTVRILSLGTTLVDAADGDHLVEPGKVKLTDTVEYTGLTPGDKYTVAGTLMDKAANSPLKDASGKEITASAELVPEKASGTAEVTFEFDASSLQDGASVVAFERLLDSDGKVVASHEDIDDQDQTVTSKKPNTPDKQTTSGNPSSASHPQTTAANAPGGKYGKTGAQVAAIAIGAALLAAAGAAAIAHGTRRKKGGK